MGSRVQIQNKYTIYVGYVCNKYTIHIGLTHQDLWLTSPSKVQMEICWTLTFFELELLFLELYTDTQKKQEMITYRILSPLRKSIIWIFRFANKDQVSCWWIDENEIVSSTKMGRYFKALGKRYEKFISKSKKIKPHNFQGVQVSLLGITCNSPLSSPSSSTHWETTAFL